MRLDSIQALRGAACLLVVLFHASEFESAFGLRRPPLRVFRWFGYAGVDLFFVISGFVIAYAHRHQFGRPGQIPGFLFKRAWRIYPTYWAALGLTFLHFAATVAQYPWDAERERFIGPAAALAPAPPNEMQPWLPQAWTLSHELAFYLTFAGLLALPKRAAAVLLVGWFAAVVWAASGFRYQIGGFAPLWLSAHVAQFLAGVAVGLTLGTPTRRTARLAAVAAAVALATGLALTFHPDPYELPRNIPLRALVFGVPAALVVFAAAAWDVSGGRSPPRRLVRVGEASYSIYLVHLLTQAWAFHGWGQTGLGHGKIWHPVWLCLLVAAAIGGGWLLHITVERPLQNLVKRRKPPATLPATPELRRAA